MNPLISRAQEVADGKWRACKPIFPRWVDGKFRRENLERRVFLVGGFETFRQVEWRTAKGGQT